MNDLKPYIELSKKQMSLDIDAIKLAFLHSPTKGSESENVVIEKLLKKYLPTRYSIGGGFITSNGKLTPQLDIIIHDNILNTPVYRGVGSSVFSVGSVYGAIEITMQKLNKKKLEIDIKKLSEVRKILPNEKSEIMEIYSEQRGDQKGSVVAERIIESAPAPRTYMISLSGSSYKTIDQLSRDVEGLTRKHSAHLHGLLVLNEPNAQDWLVSTKAFENFAVQVGTDNALYNFIEIMKKSFLGMLVGRYPAAG